jgi:hypothetical protein
MKFYYLSVQFNLNTTDDYTDVKTEFHFTPHTRRHIHKHRTIAFEIFRRKMGRDSTLSLPSMSAGEVHG